MVLYSNLFLNSSAKKSNILFISDLVRDIFRSEHQPHQFYQTGSLCLIEDVFLLFAIKLEALHDIPSVTKICLSLFRLLVAVKFCITSGFKFPDGIFSKSLSAGKSSEFFTDNFRSSVNLGWVIHAGVIMSIIRHWS